MTEGTFLILTCAAMLVYLYIKDNKPLCGGCDAYRIDCIGWCKKKDKKDV